MPYNKKYTEHLFLIGGNTYMTAKEELKNLINSLTPQELAVALTVFRAHSLKTQGEQQPPILKVQTQNLTIPA